MMNTFRLITRSLRHFKGTNLATAMGIAIATAVICGALIIGDSLRLSLEQIVEQRLGNTTHTITAGERIFSRGLGNRLGQGGLAKTAPVLKTEAIASIQGSQVRVNKVDVWGVDSLFEEVAGEHAEKIIPGENEVIINEHLAGRLMVDTGDYILLRIKTIGPIPSNTPFVSETDQTITRRLKVISIRDKNALGHFNMQASQSSPLNAFVQLEWLNQIMDLNDMANMVVVKAEESMSSVVASELVKQAWRPEDGGISLRNIDTVKYSGTEHQAPLQLTSQRVFIDNYLSDVIQEVFPDAIPALTYFVNSLDFNGKSTPYSFVSAIDRFYLQDKDMVAYKEADDKRLSQPLKPLQVEDGQIIINEWLADDLGIGPGDSLRMRYFEIGALRELVEREAYFMVSHIIPMERAMQDSVLMPHLPGLSDAGSCSDWEAGIPIDLDAIRQKDEDYWDTFKGTPKAYISLEQGQQLWQNRFGNLTSILLTNKLYSVDSINNLLSDHVDPAQLGFMVKAVREEGITAARGGVDFGQLFAALGIFIIISGLLLTLLLQRFSLKQRQNQIKLFTSLGFPHGLIRKILVWEAFLVTLSGIIAGLFISIGYSKVIFSALNTNWYDIVRTDTLILYYQLPTLFIGLLISLVLGMSVIYWGIRKAIKEYVSVASKSSVYRSQMNQDASGQAKNDHLASKQPATKLLYSRISAFSLLLAVVFAAYLGLTARFDWVFAWLATGIILMFAFITRFYYLLYRLPGKPSLHINLKALGRKNMIRNPLRSFTIILLLALGSFVIVVTAANRKEVYSNDSLKSSGTGGFQFMAETTVPILKNLNQSSSRVELGLPENAHFVQFLSSYDDDASCLNLNMVANPRILAVDPEELKGRFSFVSSHPWLDKESPWKSLDSTYQEVVPAIADQSVIQWGLGKQTGDTLIYANARGEEVKLLLIGGLANSIFQGHVIISTANFLEHFPDHGGSNVLLIETADEDTQSLEESLAVNFRDYGWEMTSTPEKLAGFNSVQNTYLQIFFLMGAFGMLLGTIGLAVILARNMVDRRAEMALLRSIGYKTSHIILLFFYEYASLFLAGILTGTLSALLATLPNFLSASQNISIAYLAGVLVVLLINGFFWLLAIPTVMIRRLRLLEALRNE